MRRVVAVALSVPTLVAAMIAVPGTAAAAPSDVPSAPYTALGVQASAGVDTGGATEVTGGGVTAVTLTTSSARFTGGAINLEVYAPTGSTWQVGQAYAVNSTGDSTHAVARVANDPNRTCILADSGSVTVLEATADDTGAVTAFAADAELGCGSSRFSASVRWHSSVGYAGVTLTQAVAYPAVDLGGYTDRSVVLTATGTDPLPFLGDGTFGGENPEAFSIVGDDCKQQSLAAGTSCTVVVRARPLIAGASTGTLVLVHDSASPWEVVLSASARETATGTFHPVNPRRILDTRSGLGGRKGPLPAAGVLHLGVTSGLSGPASAVVLNLTVDRPLTAGYLTAYPSGTSRPVASSINFPAGWQGANLVTVPVGANGQIDIYNYVGSTTVIADLVGWYSSAVNATTVRRGGGYHAKNVERLFDSRKAGFRLGPDEYVTLGVYYDGDQRDIAAMSTNITAVNPGAQGYLAVWDGVSAFPTTSTLNFKKGSGVVSNAAIIPTSYGDPDCPDCTEFAVVNRSGAPVDLVVDINGFFDRGDLVADVRYRPLTSPTRIVDTRISQGATTLPANTTRTVTTPTAVAGYDTVALDANVTAVTPTGQTYVTVWPDFDGYPRPLASTLNPTAKQTVANHAIAEVGFGNRFNLYNALGTTNLLVDVSGTFEYYPATPADQIPRTPTPLAEPSHVASAGRAAPRVNRA